MGWGRGMPRAKEAAGSGGVLTPMGFGTGGLHVLGGPRASTGGCSPASHSEKGPGCPWPEPPSTLTGVVAGDAGGTAKHLPEQGGILLSVLDEHVLQGLRPVQLIEDDGGCGRQSQGGWMSAGSSRAGGDGNRYVPIVRAGTEVVCPLCPWRRPQGLCSHSCILLSALLPWSSSITLLWCPQIPGPPYRYSPVHSPSPGSGAATAAAGDSQFAISSPSQRAPPTTVPAPFPRDSHQLGKEKIVSLRGCAEPPGPTLHSCCLLHLTQKQLRCRQTAVLNYSAIKAEDKLLAAPACD